jgi:hypothetical protein
MGGRDVGDQRIAWGAAYALADAIDEAGGDDPAEIGGERKNRLGEGGKPIAEGG